MKQALVFVLIAGLVIACSSSTSNSADSGNSQKTSETVSAKVDGKAIYKQYCITCHGLYGDMGASGAANLKESKLTQEERILVITNGRNTMTAFKTLLNEEKIKAVAEYTMTLSKNEEEE